MSIIGSISRWWHGDAVIVSPFKKEKPAASTIWANELSVKALLTEYKLIIDKKSKLNASYRLAILARVKRVKNK